MDSETLVKCAHPPCQCLVWKRSRNSAVRRVQAPRERPACLARVGTPDAWWMRNNQAFTQGLKQKWNTLSRRDTPEKDHVETPADGLGEQAQVTLQWVSIFRVVNFDALG
jgi:hypothetical protein